MFNNLGLTLATNLKFYTSVAKRLKLKVRESLGLDRTFVEVIGQKLVEENRVKEHSRVAVSVLALLLNSDNLLTGYEQLSYFQFNVT